MGKVPKEFKNLKEEAKFWENVNLDKILDEFEIDKETTFMRKSKKVSLFRVDPKIAEAVRKISKAKGISQSALVQIFIKEGLKR